MHQVLQVMQESRDNADLFVFLCGWWRGETCKMREGGGQNITHFLWECVGAGLNLAGNLSHAASYPSLVLRSSWKRWTNRLAWLCSAPLRETLCLPQSSSVSLTNPSTACERHTNSAELRRSREPSCWKRGTMSSQEIKKFSSHSLFWKSDN